MTNAQMIICKYIDQQFVPGSVKKTCIGLDRVRVTDRKGESLTFTVNIFGDIIDDDTNKIVAEADTVHSVAAPFKMPHTWKNQPGNYNWS